MNLNNNKLWVTLLVVLILLLAMYLFVEEYCNIGICTNCGKILTRRELRLNFHVFKPIVLSQHKTYKDTAISQFLAIKNCKCIPNIFHSSTKGLFGDNRLLGSGQGAKRLIIAAPEEKREKLVNFLKIYEEKKCKNLRDIIKECLDGSNSAQVELERANINEAWHALQSN